MQIRIVALAGMLVFLQASAADQLIKLPKPADIEAATQGKISPASASAQASAPAAASSSASVPVASASAASSAPSASASVAAPSASASAKASAVASASASASAVAKATEAVKQTAQQVQAAPQKKKEKGDISDEEDAANMQRLASKIAERVGAVRQKQPVGPYTQKAQTSKKSVSVSGVRQARASRAPEAAVVPVVAHGSQWHYEGDAGPAQWGKLNPAWARCATGNRQSPIDIRDGMQLDLEKIQFDYRPGPFSVIDNGHTVQVNVSSGNRITITGRTYELDQFHFHRPSEERVNGRGFPMVVHLVHKDAEGRVAEVAVLIEEGATNPVVQNVWNNLPLEKNDPVRPAIQIDINQLLPARRDYYTYMGSLTTPPCSEGVLWVVMKEPIQLSSQQIAIFSRLYPMNARPIQADSGRIIKESN